LAKVGVNMKIVFMGTPDFARGILQALVESKKYEITAVVTQPDRPKGRGNKVLQTPVKEYALSVNLPVYQPQKVKTPEFTAKLRELAPDIIVVAAFGQLLSQAILDIPRVACVNVHASLLPKYRGAAPLQYALLKGEKESGVTLMHMEAGMDTGGSYAQARVPISPEMTYGQLHDACLKAGAELLLAKLDAIGDGSLNFVPQEEALATKATLLTREMELLDWSKPAAELHNQIRAFNPAPGAYTTLPDGRKLKIFSARLAEGSGKPGQVIRLTKHSFVAACGTGALEVLEVQPESKKRMPAQGFLSGHGVSVGDELGASGSF
jgi:methionyl-tRNA formyltransferase